MIAWGRFQAAVGTHRQLIILSKLCLFTNLCHLPFSPLIWFSTAAVLKFYIIPAFFFFSFTFSRHEFSFLFHFCISISFLDAPSHLYKRLRPSVRRSVGPSVRPFIVVSLKPLDEFLSKFVGIFFGVIAPGDFLFFFIRSFFTDLGQFLGQNRT